MSNLSFMEKLLDGVEVEWKALGDVTQKWYSGGTPTAGNPEYYEAGNIPWLRTQEVKFSDIESTQVKVTQAALDNSSAKWIPSNCVIVAISGATAGRSAINKIPLTTNQHCGCLEIDSTQALYRYVYHWVCYNYQNIKALGQGARGDLNSSIVKSFKIPIPCPENPNKSLEIQTEIVHILDTFTELTTELTTELSARKKQYNYYRDQLLSFDVGEVEHLPMGHEGIGEFIRGGGLQKKDFTEMGVGCIHYGQIYTHYGTYTDKTKTYVSKEFFKKARKAKSGDLVIATTSENDEDLCKAVAWLGSEDIAVSSDACFYRHKLNPKYVSYFFQTEQFHKQKRQYITGTKVRRVNADNLAKILIPIPSPEEQARIVAILDKFDTLTSSVSKGLPREIALRQQQYEYYRDLLLSFPKPDAEVAA
jgi:type I restriction enzyme S subunit